MLRIILLLTIFVGTTSILEAQHPHPLLDPHDCVHCPSAYDRIHDHHFEDDYFHGDSHHHHYEAVDNPWHPAPNFRHPGMSSRTPAAVPFQGSGHGPAVPAYTFQRNPAEALPNRDNFGPPQNFNRSRDFRNPPTQYAPRQNLGNDQRRIPGSQRDLPLNSSRFNQENFPNNFMPQPDQRRKAAPYGNRQNLENSPLRNGTPGQNAPGSPGKLPAPPSEMPEILPSSSPS